MRETRMFFSYFCDKCQEVYEIPCKSKKEENEPKYCYRGHGGPAGKTKLRKLEGFKRETKTMPLFTYFCTQCDYKEEFLVKDHKSKVKCKNCNVDMKKFSSRRVSVKFMGPGWSADGYSNLPESNTSEMMDSDLPTTVRIPHYADKNTGKYLGTGSPEVPIGKE